MTQAITSAAYRDTAREADFQATITQMAEHLGYLVYHNPDSRRSVAGYPDLHILGHGFSIHVELKTAKGRIRPEQRVWISELQCAGLAVAVIRPDNIHLLEALLTQVREGENPDGISFLGYNERNAGRACNTSRRP